jgi:hypothetical protein
MSTPTLNQQASQTLTNQLVNNTNVINRKVDELASALGGLSIGDEVRHIIDQQLGEIRENIQGNNANQDRSLKLKPLDHYDGVSRPLRSWLTEADLHMENKSIVRDDARVRFVGGHLKGRAWDWFEPFMRERGEKPKVEWSDRTVRVLGSYREMRKAMGQFSVILMNERPQHGSYRNFDKYIRSETISQNSKQSQQTWIGITRP